jgi:L-ascorbate metabolism protein UlaG (beta-lactamase superfamily)
VSGLRLTHIGGPTLLVELDGWRILTDPTFDAPGKRYQFGFGTSSTKVAGPAIAISELGRIDAVLLTHDHHADNLDDRGRELLAAVPIVVTTRAGAARLGGEVVGLDPWEVAQVEHASRPALEVVATPCRHGPPLSRPLVGDVIGFALRPAGTEPVTLWISGDTVLYPGVREVATRLDVAVAVFHVGAVRFPVTGPLRYSMTIDDAIELCDSLSPRVAIPVHYDGWSHFSEGRDVIAGRLDRAPSGVRDRFRLLDPGAPTVIG